MISVRRLHRDPSPDAYADLRYDPDWRSKLKAPEHFSDSPRLRDPDRRPSGSPPRCRGTGGELLVMRGGYEYVVTASPPLAPGPPGVAQDGPYRLHPQPGPPGNPDRPRSRVPVLRTLGKGDGAEQRERSHGENRKVPAKPRQNMPETQEAAVAVGKPSKNPSKYKGPLQGSRNLEGTREDIVERNKITLGRNTTKCGSYLKAHAPRRETDAVKVCGERTPNSVVLLFYSRFEVSTPGLKRGNKRRCVSRPV